MSSLSNIDYELLESIIAQQALTNEAYLSSIIDVVKPSYFKKPGIRLLFNILKSHVEAYNTLPTTTEIKLRLTTEEDKRLFKEILMDFKSLNITINFDVLVASTEKFFRDKAIHDAIVETVNNGAKGKELVPDAILKTFEDACNISLVNSMGMNYTNEIDKHIEDLSTVRKVIPTGWKWMDEALGGGLMEVGRALYVFMGPSNVGKSIFLGNIACNILKQNKKVLLISLEMSEMMYAQRISTQISQIPIKELVNNAQGLKEVVLNFKAQCPVGELMIKEFPPKTVTPNHLRAYIKKLAQKGFKPDVIVLDYLNLMQPTGGDNSYEQVKELAEKVRAITYEFNCPIVTATQANRSAYKQANPGMEAISESMGTAHTCDAMFSLFQEDGDSDLGVIKVGIAKNRFGRNTGIAAMRVDYNTLTLFEEEGYLGLDNEDNSSNALDAILGKDKQPAKYKR